MLYIFLTISIDASAAYICKFLFFRNKALKGYCCTSEMSFFKWKPIHLKLRRQPFKRISANHVTARISILANSTTKREN